MYFIIQSIALFLYFIVSAVWVFNGVRYLVIKRRFKEFSIALFYSFTISLMVVRICQHAYEMTIVLDEKV